MMERCTERAERNDKPTIPLTVDGLIAMAQFLEASAPGQAFWRTFWAGDTVEGGGKDDRTPRYGEPAAQMLRPMFWG